jgi:hypothetical protein
MQKLMLPSFLFLFATTVNAQSPAITSWLQNNTVNGSYYMSGNSTPISNNIKVNCQTVQYNTTDVYITTNGIPAYPTGPFLDGNPSQATDQNAIFKFPLTPVENTGTPSPTTMGNIGVFINGVALFDYRDGVSWKNSTGAEAGGPLGGTGDGVWNRDAIVAEMEGFDCSKGHPAMGNYHHHQNPSAFDLDLNVLSNICNLYDADGLYAINPSVHSPLLGFAYDGFPIYGAYGYANNDGTGGITRIKSSYQLRSITVRTHYADGTDVTDGPPVNSTYPLGRYKEDYELITPSSDDQLDEHNGRFCVTPEYPAGTYCYFLTVDANHNSAYPYAVGPTFYGTYANRKVTSIPGGTTTYTSTVGMEEEEFNAMNINVFPNPASDLIAIQIVDLVKEDLTIELLDIAGKLISSKNIYKGTTIAFFETETLYNGTYLIKISNQNSVITRKVIISRD